MGPRDPTTMGPPPLSGPCPPSCRPRGLSPASSQPSSFPSSYRRPTQTIEGEEAHQTVLINIGLLGDAGVGNGSLIEALTGEFESAGSGSESIPWRTVHLSSRLSVTMQFHDITTYLSSPPTSSSLSSVPTHAQPGSDRLHPIVSIVTSLNAVLYCFDLKHKSSLNGVKEWYRSFHSLYKSLSSSSEKILPNTSVSSSSSSAAAAVGAVTPPSPTPSAPPTPFLIGTNHADFLSRKSIEDRTVMRRLATKFAEVMKSDLIVVEAGSPWPSGAKEEMEGEGQEEILPWNPTESTEVLAKVIVRRCLGLPATSRGLEAEGAVWSFDHGR